MKLLKNNKIKYLFILILFTLVFSILNIYINNVYAAGAKLVLSPQNPRVGDTVVLKAIITGNNAYSIAFTNIDESNALEYISMDDKKVSQDELPITGEVQAKFKVLSANDVWIDAKVKVESGPIKNKKIDVSNLSSANIERRVNITVVPEAKDVEEMTAKYKVTDNGVNIRPYPSTKYSSLGVYNKDKVIDVTGKSGDWYQFTYSGKKAYMHKDFLKLVPEEKKEEPVETEQTDVEEETQEEVKDPNIRDPKDQADNSTFLIILAILLSAGIIAAIVILVRGKDANEDDSYVKQDKENKMKDIFKKRNKNNRNFDDEF